MPDLPAADYCTQAADELRGIEPRLRDKQVAAPTSRLSLSQAVTVAGKAFGPLGYLFGAVGWFVYRLRKEPAPTEASFRTSPASSARDLQVHRARNRADLNLDLKITIDGTAPQISLSWGTVYMSSEFRISETERRKRLSTNHWPREPVADARFIGSIVKGILDDRIALIRWVEFQECGMSGPIHPVAYDSIFDLDEATFLLTHTDTLQRIERSCEAISYTWRGHCDECIVPPRYDQAKPPWYSFDEPAQVRLPKYS